MKKYNYILRIIYGYNFLVIKKEILLNLQTQFYSGCEDKDLLILPRNQFLLYLPPDIWLGQM